MMNHSVPVGFPFIPFSSSTNQRPESAYYRVARGPTWTLAAVARQVRPAAHRRGCTIHQVYTTVLRGSARAAKRRQPLSGESCAEDLLPVPPK